MCDSAKASVFPAAKDIPDDGDREAVERLVEGWRRLESVNRTGLSDSTVLYRFLGVLCYCLERRSAGSSSDRSRARWAVRQLTEDLARAEADAAAAKENVIEGGAE